MTRPLADIAEIEARHSDIGRSGRRTITKAFEDAHNDRATLLRAYRELAGELEAVSKSSALLRRSRQERCTNGFPVNAGCVGIVGAIPVCLNERLCGRLYPETGQPDRCEPFTSDESASSAGEKP